MQRKNHLRLILGIILQHILILGKPFCYRATPRPCKG